MNEMIWNFNQLNMMLEKFNQTQPEGHPQIASSHIFIGSVLFEGHFRKVWIEQNISSGEAKFQKFWGDPKKDLVSQFLSTQVKVLQELQYFVYLQSGYQFSIIDLQGVFDNVQNLYILTDITFTSNPPAAYSAAMLLSE
jgi:hypothetical protein